MMEKICAEEIHNLSLKAVTALSEILNVSQNNCSEEAYENLKKGVGLSIGTIQTNILDFISTNYPELDDLK